MPTSAIFPRTSVARKFGRTERKHDMPATILSQDIVAICLFHADGNIDLSLENILFHVETYQEGHNRHFGISRGDFRGLFYRLIFMELGMKKFGDDLNDIRLRGVISKILTYHSAYFNDEGEHWIKDDVRWHEEDQSGYNVEAYQEKTQRKEDMHIFFQPHELRALNPIVVKEFMKKTQITDSISYHCSRPGESS